MGDETIAYLNDGQATYFAREKVAPHYPSSAIVKLIQGVYESYPAQARRILRNRIFSTHLPTEMCWGMIKVAARKFEAPVAIQIHSLISNPHATEMKGLDFSLPEPFEIALKSNPSHSDFLLAARALSSKVPRNGARYECDRAIAAILVAPDGVVLSWAVNSNAKNKTQHAEVNALQKYYTKYKMALPRGTRLYSTLKPCRMCAAMMWQMAEDFRSIKVYYAEFDSGPNARSTVLNAGSLERRRACSERAAIHLELEEQVLI
jgi:tRNA(Arg) A34 adenosine deaminase TadA